MLPPRGHGPGAAVQNSLCWSEYGTLFAQQSEHCSLKGFGVFDLIGGNDSGIELSGRSTEPCLRSKASTAA